MLFKNFCLSSFVDADFNLYKSLLFLPNASDIRLIKNSPFVFETPYFRNSKGKYYLNDPNSSKDVIALHKNAKDHSVLDGLNMPNANDNFS
jgi:hypothetical protein